ncbi:mitochondrial 39-S ribosomal protein L47 (MRP-L47)-domain-containing protein [Syncephalis fuscata]|nr:mitochondrial 39-S ribosomal protein L47 (MRP-L47)-domain-containing protein [Syncephalis fuscata]
MSLWTQRLTRFGLIRRTIGEGLARPFAALFSTTPATLNAPAGKPRLVAASSGTDKTDKRHGLLDFFEDGKALPKESAYTGRAWRASELRQKSFDDLHKLWYVLLKERNLLSSQWAEAKRYGIMPQQFNNFGREVKCRKSMARILTVLRERHLMHERALKRHRREQFVERRALEFKTMTKNTDFLLSETTFAQTPLSSERASTPATTSS